MKRPSPRKERILHRIDAALEKMCAEKMEVRAIYLTVEDHDQLDAELNAKQKYVSAHLSYRGHQIRGGETSRIYSTHGVAVTIPKRLSPRTKAAA